jgi:phage terminase large subunit-like protein
MGPGDLSFPEVGVARWDAAWHRRLDAELAALVTMPPEHQRAVRRALGEDPVAFAIIYLGHHLKDRQGRISFAEVHYQWAELGLTWRTRETEPQSNRHAFIAPRETGKSTWWFLILPMWAAAYGYRNFAVAFADTAAQAQTHLTSFKRELETNPLIGADFPELAAPARKRSGHAIADRAGMIHQRNGFVLAARGIDAATLGLKVEERRPDLLIFDDVEPDEASYSADQAVKRLGTITDAAFPLNIYAAVVMVGTVTMPGSITHSVVKAAQGVEVADWIRDEGVQCHHHLPIMINDDGTERSIWPEKWPLAWLLSIQHTRSYAKNYANDPMGRDGAYWTKEDFAYGTIGPLATRWILTLDPAVTTKGTSDWTGWAIVGFDPSGRRVEVAAAGQVKLVGEPLRRFVLEKLAEYPRVKAVLIEVNQGGDLWRTVLHSLPIQLLVHTSSEPKEVRFAWALDFYQAAGGRVLHRERLRQAEEQMVAFPKAPHDDIADAVVAGVLYFMRTGPARSTVATAASYV